MNLTLLLPIFVFVGQSCVHASSTDNGNVKVINCNNTQTVSAKDKSTLFAKGFTKCAEPFGILIAGSKNITNKSVLAMAKVVAELLDQNKDGVADDPKVVGKLKCNVWFPLHNKSVTWTLSGHPNRYEVDNFWTSGVWSFEQKNRVRAEEAHHAITQMGYAKAYPSVFGLSSNSTLLKECNKATCDWWTHPENKCLKKKPLLKNVQKCMKTWLPSAGLGVYPGNGGQKCTASQNEQSCNDASCNCIEWYHQVNIILAGQTPSWIASFRNKAGLKGDKVMPKTSKAMKALLAKKNKPLLALWKNKKYNQLQKPMTFKYPTVKKTTPKLSVCS